MTRPRDPFVLACLAVLTVLSLVVSARLGRALNERDEARGQLRIVETRCVFTDAGGATCPDGVFSLDGGVRR